MHGYHTSQDPPLGERYNITPGNERKENRIVVILARSTNTAGPKDTRVQIIKIWEESRKLSTVAIERKHTALPLLKAIIMTT